MKRKGGYTLVEVLTACGVILLLAGLGLGAASMARAYCAARAQRVADQTRGMIETLERTQ